MRQGGPGRGARRLGAVRRRGDAAPRAASCWRRWRARGRCSSRSRRSSRPRSSSTPRRVVSGLDRNRLALVLAVLGRHGGIGLGRRGRVRQRRRRRARRRAGVRPGGRAGGRERGRGVPLHGHVRRPPCFGELGLTGELRWVGHPERRLAEAAKLGCADVIAPAGQRSAVRCERDDACARRSPLASSPSRLARRLPEAVGLSRR